MAAYNADIQIGVKGINNLRTLEQQLNRVSNSAKKISQTLQGLKVNQQTVKINTQGALKAVKTLEQRLNKLNKPVTVDVRYKETRSSSRGANRPATSRSESRPSLPQPAQPKVEIEGNKKLIQIESRRKEIYGQLTSDIQKRNRILEQQKKNIDDLRRAGQGADQAQRVFGSKAGSKRTVGEAIFTTGKQVLRQDNQINSLNTGIDRLRAKYEALTRVSNAHYNQERKNILQNVSATELFDKKLELIQRRRKTRRAAAKGGAAAAAIGLSNVPGVGAIAQGAGIGGAVGGLPGAAAGAAVQGVISLSGATLQYADAAARAAAEQLRFEQALQGITFGDDYRKALQSVSDLSDQFQVDIGETTKQFTKLTAATSANGISIEETEKVYAGLAAANVALGGDAERLQGILLATSQVFSKGKVQAEELRGQIGERLSGAFALFAQSMNKTPAQLDALLNKGEVTVEDFVNFTTTLFERFGNRASEMIQSPANAGQRLEKALGDLQRNVGTLLAPVGAAFQDIFTGIVTAIDRAAVALNNFLGIGTEGAINKTQGELDGAVERVLRFQAQVDEGKGGNRAKQNLTTARSDMNAAIDKLQELKAKQKGLAPTAPTRPLDTQQDNDKGSGTQPAEPVDTTARTRVAIQLQNELLRIEREKFDLIGQEASLEQFALERQKLKAQLVNDLALIKQSNITAESKLEESELRRIEHQTDLAALANKEQEYKIAQKKAFEDQVTELQRGIELESATSDEMRRQLELKHALLDLEGQDLTPERKKELEELLKKRKALADRNADPIFQYMTQLKNSINDTRGQIASLARTIESELASAMTSAVTGLIDGTTTVEEALSSMLKNIGKAFIEMAMKILAQKAILAILTAVFGGGNLMGGKGYYDPFNGLGTAGPNFGLALGGPVTPKKPYLVGETGPELFIPSESGIIGTNAMFDAAAGAIKSGASSTSPEDAENEGGFDNPFAAAASALVNTNNTVQSSKVVEMQMAQNAAIENPEPIDVRFQSTVINNVSYVSVEEFQAGMTQTANRARSMTLKDLRNKPSTRRSTGVA